MADGVFQSWPQQYLPAHMFFYNVMLLCHQKVASLHFLEFGQGLWVLQPREYGRSDGVPIPGVAFTLPDFCLLPLGSQPLHKKSTLKPPCCEKSKVIKIGPGDRHQVEKPRSTKETEEVKCKWSHFGSGPSSPSCLGYCCVSQGKCPVEPLPIFDPKISWAK